MSAGLSLPRSNDLLNLVVSSLGDQGTKTVDAAKTVDSVKAKLIYLLPFSLEFELA